MILTKELQGFKEPKGGSGQMASSLRWCDAGDGLSWTETTHEQRDGWTEGNPRELEVARSWCVLAGLRVASGQLARGGRRWLLWWPREAASRCLRGREMGG